MRDKARENIEKKLGNAMVVITDHKRYSVALFYDLQNDESAPKVVEKGDIHTFEIINQEASKKGIDLFDSPFLACMLHLTTDVDQEIIKDHYLPVAHVIAFVMNSRYGSEYRFKKPNPDRYILRSMGLNIKTGIPN